MTYQPRLPDGALVHGITYTSLSDTVGTLWIPSQRIITSIPTHAVATDFCEFLGTRERHLALKSHPEPDSPLWRLALSPVGWYLEGVDRGKVYAAFLVDQGFLCPPQGSNLIPAIVLRNSEYTCEDAPTLDRALLEHYAGLLGWKSSETS